MWSVKKVLKTPIQPTNKWNSCSKHKYCQIERLVSQTKVRDDTKDGESNNTDQTGTETEIINNQLDNTSTTKSADYRSKNNNFISEAELMTEQVDDNVVNADTIDAIIDRADNDLNIKMNDIDSENKPDAKQVLEDKKRSNQNQVFVVAAADQAASCGQEGHHVAGRSRIKIRRSKGSSEEAKY